jgi:predicted enzyme related to lactoylglutathione lyase
MPYLHGKFVWFEHFSADIPAARHFYGELFGWTSEAIPGGGEQYPMIHNAGAGIGGFRTLPPSVPPHWLAYLSVADVDATVANALRRGARVIVPPTDFAPWGRAAAIADPQGATLSVWKGAEGDRPDAAEVALGDWIWVELMTSDAEQALAFYEAVFGYTHEVMQMPERPYYVLRKDGVGRAGLMRSPEPGVPPNWTPYVRVADCAATLARANALGGKTIHPATEVPGIGTFGVLADPTGAVLAVFVPKM